MEIREYLENTIEKMDIEKLKAKFPEYSTYEIISEIEFFLSQKMSEQVLYERLNELIIIIISEFSNLLDAEKIKMLDRLITLSAHIKNVIRTVDKKKILPSQLRSIKKAKKLLKDFIDDVLYSMSLDDKIYDYLYYIIHDIKNIEIFKQLYDNQEQYLYITDKIMNRLFLNISRHYLDTYDDFYIQTISVILSRIKNVDKNALNSILEEIEFQKSTNFVDSSLEKFVKLLDRFIDENDKIKKDNYVLAKPKFNQPLEWIDYEGRCDLTSKLTFLVKTDGLSTTAYSIDETEGGFEVYAHVSDIDAYNKENVSCGVYSYDFIEKYATLKENNKSLTVTIKILFDKNFRMISSDIFESVIKVDETYVLEDFFDRQNIPLRRLLKIARNYKTGENLNSFDLIESLEDIINIAVARIAQANRRPSIYENILPSYRLTSNLQIGEYIDITERTWRRKEAQRLSTLGNNMPPEVKVYSPKNLGSTKLVRASVPIVNPEKNSISLHNLRLAKKYLVNGKLQEKLSEQDRVLVEVECLVENAKKASM